MDPKQPHNQVYAIKMKFEFQFCSSFAKVFPAVKPEVSIRSGRALRGERYAFQIPYRMAEAHFLLDIQADSLFDKNLRIRKVGLVPVDYTGSAFDDGILSQTSGLYPDLLSDVTDQNPLPLMSDWRAVWISVNIPK